MYVTVMMIDILTYGIIAGSLLLVFLLVKWVVNTFKVKNLEDKVSDLNMTKDTLVEDLDTTSNALHLSDAMIDEVIEEEGNWTVEEQEVPVTFMKRVRYKVRK